MNSVTICMINEKDDVSNKKYKNEKNKNSYVNTALSEKF